MYTAFSFLFGAVVIAVSVLPYCVQDRRVRRACFIADAVLCALGALSLLLSLLLAGGIFSDSALAEDYRDWASDLFYLWVRVSGVSAAVAGGAVLTAALIRHPLRRIRTAVAAAVSVVLLILGGAFSAFAWSETADLVTTVHLWTLGCAALVLAGPAVDAWRAMREKPKPAAPKKKKS